jgi:hypothetical protein
VVTTSAEVSLRLVPARTALEDGDGSGIGCWRACLAVGGGPGGVYCVLASAYSLRFCCCCWLSFVAKLRAGELELGIVIGAVAGASIVA